MNLMGRGMSLGDLVEWRIGAGKKRKGVLVSRVVERLGDYSSEFQEGQSRYKGNRTATNADFETRPILYKGKSPRDRPSARNVQFKLPSKTDIINISTSQTQKNAESGQRKDFFE